MTAAAREVLADFDPATDNPTRNCTPKSMPTIMEQPLPMEIVRDVDPVNFTEPVVLNQNLLHVPGMEILPFECEEYAAN